MAWISARHVESATRVAPKSLKRRTSRDLTRDLRTKWRLLPAKVIRCVIWMYKSIRDCPPGIVWNILVVTWFSKASKANPKLQNPKSKPYRISSYLRALSKRTVLKCLWYRTWKYKLVIDMNVRLLRQLSMNFGIRFGDVLLNEHIKWTLVVKTLASMVDPMIGMPVPHPGPWEPGMKPGPTSQKPKVLRSGSVTHECVPLLHLQSKVETQ